ncbi:Fe-S cluster assembly protein SufD [Lusitaniella coriacea]|uniref:Fe-S cluster assembly protein SufD n=1 Tax=Lusitaniella coriacea TaxID=1983105 RepID=UPI003CF5A1CB
MAGEVSSHSISNSEQGDSPANRYLRELLRQSEEQKIPMRAENSGLLQELRQRAAYDVAQQQMPTRKDEDWRFTDLSELREIHFLRVQPAKLSPADIAPFVLPEAQQSCIVFVNGVYEPQLSDTSALPSGLFVGNLAQLRVEDSFEAIKYIARQEGSKEVFTALNSTGFPDIAILWAKANAVVEAPIHLLFLTVLGDSPTFCQPRGLVIAEKGSSLTFVEHYAVIAEGCSDTPQNRAYFTNSVMEVFVKENARVNHTRNQRESGDGFHIGKTAVSQEKNSHYTCNAITLGGKLSRHNLDVWQKGKQTETHLNGLTTIGQEQVADTHSAILLAHPHGTTDQLHKCIVDDRARAIFNGKVCVPKDAQLTNAAQLNRNLLLSPRARVDTKPELQITADNVKCTHGATVSQIDSDELFYLQSRGINADDARHLLLDAFAGEILERLPVASLRKALAQCVACRTYD